MKIVKLFSVNGKLFSVSVAIVAILVLCLPKCIHAHGKARIIENDIIVLYSYRVDLMDPMRVGKIIVLEQDGLNGEWKMIRSGLGSNTSFVTLSGLQITIREAQVVPTNPIH